MADMNQLQALFGGTFDPVHYGHLKPVEALANMIGLSRVIIMPNNVPPHRPQPEATSQQRKKMVELAIADKPLFSLDERELQRDAPSWTAQTLQEWRQEQGPQRPLAFIIGQDSLLGFPGWHNYESILDNCHLIVCRRPGYPLTMQQEEHQQWLERHLTPYVEELHTLPAGKIFLAETPWFNISATLIRERLEKGESCEDLLPAAVLDYINAEGLYR
ncbi:nicotinate-nucleotide adenylyltransferase [Salmonella enterica]